METGERFPSFTGSSQDGESVDLEQYRDGDNLVVFFYPRAGTSGCVRETTEFAARRTEFDVLNTKLVGISVDKVPAQKKHAITCAATFPIVSDADKTLTSTLGILRDTGSAQRTTYIVDRGGVVQRVFASVKVDGHVDKVLAAIRELPA